MIDKSPAVLVSQERWLEAQQSELKVWRKQNRWYRRSLARCAEHLGLRDRCSGDDWNTWWCRQFEDYRLISSVLTNVIELGCGPYTNLRLLLKNRTARYVFCSDPLARHYVKLSGCWLQRRYAGGEILLDDHAIEECPYRDEYFDLVVLINVLDHVKDAWLCLDTAIRITKPGGQLVIGQDLTDAEDVARIGEDIGHPVRLRHTEIDARIGVTLRRQFYRILSREAGRNPRAHYGTYLLIGQKQAAFSLDS